MAKQPNPAYLHIATFLRAELNARQWSVSDLHEHLGLPRTSTRAYPYLNATSAPSTEMIDLLVQLFDCKPEMLMSKEPVDYHESNVVVPFKPRNEGKLPLSFTVNPDYETASLKLDVTLPIDQASALLRMLLDSNIVMKDNT